MRWFRLAGGTLLALALGGALLLWGYTHRALPQTEGELALPGLSAPVTIERDAHGIPTIRAGNATDLMFGLGVAHAQDRLWQLQVHKRVGAGRLAEAFGPAALDTDRFLRVLGVRRAAAAQWARTQGESRAALQAYAAGVNAWLAQGLKARPPEMLLLGLRPEAWEPADSLAWVIMLGWDLGANWQKELQRLRLALKLPRERIDQVIPPYPGDGPPRTADYVKLYRELGLGANAATRTAALDRLERSAPESGVEGVGSNNWVLAAARTTTGGPLLANDPHLRLTTPALWYFARLQAPGIEVAGATIPGLPLVVLGQNAQVAWGFTNTGADVQDLYLERFHPSDPDRVQTPDGWERLAAVTEVIAVKGGADVTVVARASRHGPLISDAGTLGDVTGPPHRPAYGIAMRWTALDPDADPIGVGLRWIRSTDLQELAAAAQGWVAPMQNIVVADRSGRIGFVAQGRVPVRGPHHDLLGMVPAPGWDARYDWTGYLPADRTPRVFDPPQGWIATANQRIHGRDYPHHLTNDWSLPHRQERIEQLLRSRERHSIDDMRAMQADEKSLAAEGLLPWLARAHSAHALAGAAKRALEGFDGTMVAGSPAPLIFWAWQRNLTRLVFDDELGGLLDTHLGQRFFLFAALQGVLGRDDAWWCDDKRTAAAERCAELAGRALTQALDELQQRFGGDLGQWQWGRAHQARAEHRPFTRVKPLARLFELRVPVGGDTYTLNVSRVALRPDRTTGELYLSEHGASMRAVYDLADPGRSRFMHSAGQSGLPWSPHYRDLLGPWSRVEYVPLWPDGPPTHRLLLRPAAAAPG